MNQAQAIYFVADQFKENINEIDIEKLFNTQQKNLSRFIGKRVSNHEDAEDILQSTFFEALRNHKNFKGNSKPETWLFGIAVNLIRNYFKRQYALPKSEDLSEVDHKYQDYESDPCFVVERQTDLENVLDAIDELPEYARGIVDLVVDLDCSYQAAAEHLGIPVGTVRSRLFRARKMLKDNLTF